MLPFFHDRTIFFLKKREVIDHTDRWTILLFQKSIWNDPPAAHSMAAELYIMKHVFPRSIPGSLSLCDFYSCTKLEH